MSHAADGEMTYDEAVAYVGDRDVSQLRGMLRADDYDHPEPLAEALRVEANGRAVEAAVRIVNQVRGVVCELWGEHPVEHHTAWLDGNGDVNVCDWCISDEGITDPEWGVS
jgi:hypothetical protein